MESMELNSITAEGTANIIFPLGVDQVPISFVLYTEHDAAALTMPFAMEALTRVISAGYCGEKNEG